MTSNEKERLNGVVLMWIIIAGLLWLFAVSCVQKVIPISSKPIPVTTIVIRPDSTKTYNTTFVRYFDTFAIYLKPVKTKQ